MIRRRAQHQGLADYEDRRTKAHEGRDTAVGGPREKSENNLRTHVLTKVGASPSWRMFYLTQTGHKGGASSRFDGKISHSLNKKKHSIVWQCTYSHSIGGCNDANRKAL
jgi:hypothetical protein